MHLEGIVNKVGVIPNYWDTLCHQLLLQILLFIEIISVQHLHLGCTQFFNWGLNLCLAIWIPILTHLPIIYKDYISGT